MFMELVEKAGINGLVSGASSAVLFGVNSRVIAPYTNMTMPLYALIFCGGVISSLVADGVHVFMKEEIPVSSKANDRSSVVAGMAINAIIFAGLLQLADPSIAQDFGRISALAVGAGAEFVSASSYTYLKDSKYL